MIRRMLITIGICGSFFLLLLFFLLYTATGLNVLINTAEYLSRGKLKVENVSGNAGERFQLKDLSYISPETSFSLKSITCAWNPLAVLQGRIDIADIELDGVTIKSFAEEEESAFDWTTVQDFPEIRLPLSIDIGNLTVTQVSYQSEGADELIIDEIFLSFMGHSGAFSFKKMSLQMLGLDVQFSGNLESSGTWPVDIEGKWRYIRNSENGYNGTFSLSDSLQKGKMNLHLIAPLQVDASFDFTINQGVSWIGEIVSENFDPAIVVESLSGKLDADVLLTGEYSNSGLSGEVRIRKFAGTVNSSPVQLKGRMEFSEAGVTKAALDAEIVTTSLHLEGEVGSQTAIAYSAKIPDLKSIYPSSSGKLEVSGNIYGPLRQPHINGKITGQNFEFNSLYIPLLSGDFTSEVVRDGEFVFLFAFEDVTFMDRTVDRITLEGSGKLDEHYLDLNIMDRDDGLIVTVAGGLDELEWHGEVRELVLKSQQSGQATLEKPAALIVANDYFHLESLCLSHRQGKACVNGRLQGSKWQASAKLRGFDPAVLANNWPGQLDAEVYGEGDFDDENKVVLIQLKQLEGLLKDIPLSAGGNFELGRGGLTCEDISVYYGRAHLTANGRLSDINEFMFTGEIPSLQELHPQYSGELYFSGEISGGRSNPELTLDLEIDNGKAFDLLVESLDGEVAVNLVNDGKFQADIRGADITFNNLTLFKGTIRADGTTEDHQIKVKGKTNEGDLTLEVQGGYNESWQGDITQLSILLNKFGNWMLDGTARAHLEPQKSSIKDFCVSGTYAKFCLEGSYSQGDDWHFFADIRELSLNILSELGLINYPIQAMLTGQVQASGAKSQLNELRFNTNVPELLIAEDESEASRNFIFRDNSVGANYKNGVIAIAVASTFAENGTLMGRLNLDTINGELKSLGNAEMNGEIQVNISDLSLISVLTNSRIDPRGNLNGTMSFSGSLEDPSYSGNMKLENGELGIAELGITLTDLSIDIFNKGKNLGFLLVTLSGEGELQGRGEIDFVGQGIPTLRSNFTGNNFEAIATEEYVIRVTPDVQLVLNGKESNLSGTVTIPYARINWKPADDLIKPSRDVVIISEDNAIPHKNRMLGTNLQLTFGDDVKFEAFGLSSLIKGDIKVLNLPGKPMTLLGELRVEEGKFDFYSAELDIAQGRLLFSGGPIEDPGVDIRAVRKIGSKTVGVDVSGSAQELELQLFSDPFMVESNILSYLLVGRSLNASSENEQSTLGLAATALGLTGISNLTSGIDSFVPLDEIYVDRSEEDDASLVLGKYLTEDLYVGYDHSFFNNTGEFKVRYNLGSGFSFETKSSVDSTSGDILYTIEK